MANVRPDCLESAYGRIETDQPRYQPLDTVRVRVWGRGQGDLDTRARVWACDPQQNLTAEFELELEDNYGEVRFPAGGALGVHYLYVQFPGETRNGGRWSRYLNFEVDCDTAVQTGDPDFDDLFPFTRDHMRLGRREYETPSGRFVGYISGDTWHFDGLWLRDWIYQAPAFRFWEREMTCGLDRFLERQREDGMIHDGIERSGRTWRVGLESDVEYILVLGVWSAWQATGDDEWLRAALPKLEQALAYIQSDPTHWDPAHGLIKRQHSCDTWDYDIDGATDKGEGRHVIATCDQSGYALAFHRMSLLYAHLGDETRAEAWGQRARAYRRQANALLWDGAKYQHHFHLDAIDHDGFDESQQLAMGNTWAVTRGLAAPDQARSIVDEYRRRHEQTGDVYPWWSLQPGYPDELGYWKDSFRQQGAYANGGLMPWVGGELCRGALQNGREEYGVQLLRQWADHLRRTGGAHVWYFPDGQPGFRTTNEVNYTGWGMGEWLNALVEGLAGIRDEGSLLSQVELSPRWAAAGVQNARVAARYAASKGYLSYGYTQGGDSIALNCTGSGRGVRFHLLLPPGWAVSEVTINGAPVAFEVALEDESPYVNFAGELDGVTRVVITRG
jgi:hypothetical protein